MTYNLNTLLSSTPHLDQSHAANQLISDRDFYKKTEKAYRNDQYKSDAIFILETRAMYYAKAQHKDMLNGRIMTNFKPNPALVGNSFPMELWYDCNGCQVKLTKHYPLFAAGVRYYAKDSKVDRLKDILNGDLIVFQTLKEAMKESNDNKMKKDAIIASYNKKLSELKNGYGEYTRALYAEHARQAEVLKNKKEEEALAAKEAEDILIQARKDFMKWSLDKDENLLLKLLFIEAEVSATSLLQKGVLKVLDEELMDTLISSYNILKN